MKPEYPLARELEEAAGRMAELAARIYEPSNEGHSVRVEPRFRNHAEEIAHVLADVERADCAVQAPGLKENAVRSARPSVPPLPSELQAKPNLGYRVSAQDALGAADQHEIQVRFKW